jgi:hypothetical protein
MCFVVGCIGAIIWLVWNERITGRNPQSARQVEATGRNAKVLSRAKKSNMIVQESPRHAKREISNQWRMRKMEIENQIETLQLLEDDPWMNYAAGLSLPDNKIRELFPQYLEARRKLSHLKIAGLGDRHPTVLSMEIEINAMNDQLDEEVIQLRDFLQARLETIEEKMDKFVR